MATKVQLTGGSFQDAKGNVLANGYLIFELSQDASVSGVGNIASGVEIKIILNSSGSVDTASAQSIWGNDQMLPANTYYRVTGYNANGQPAWGPNNQQVTGSGGTFNVGTWVPNQVISWSPSPQALILETNETLNGSQSILDLHAGTNVTLTDDGAGKVTIAASGGSGLTLQTNETPNGSQNLLDLHAGTNVTLTDNGAGRVTIAASGGGSAIPGLFYSSGILPQTLQVASVVFSGGGITDVVNRVWAAKFVLPVAMTINTCQWKLQSGNPGEVFSFGIYDSTKTLVVQATFTRGTGVSFYSASLGTITLPAGVYWFAQTSNGTSVNGMNLSVTLGSTTTTAPFILNSGGSTVELAGIAANAATAGVLPGTLGAITSTSSSIQLVAALWTS